MGQGLPNTAVPSGVDMTKEPLTAFRSMFANKQDDSHDCENLLLKYLQKCAQNGGVLDRTDLQTFYHTDLENFVTPNVKFAENRCDIEVRHNGDVAKVNLKTPPVPKDKEGFPIVLKSKFTSPNVICEEDKAKVRILLATEGAGGDAGNGSSENDFHKVWRGDGTKIVDMILTIMRTLGLDSFKMVACRELVRVDYDKVEVLEDVKDGGDSSKKKWIIIGFNWAVLKYFKIVPDRDLVLDLCAEVFAGTQTKSRLLRNTSKLPPNCRDEFLEYTGPGETIDFKVFAAVKARKAHERKYTVKVFPNAASWNSEKAMKDAPILCENLVIKDCVGKILDTLRQVSRDPDNWTLLLAWEPLQVSTYEEYMHQVYQMRVRGNPEGSLETAMQCIDYLNTKCQASMQMSGTTKKAAWLPAMSRRDIDALLTSGRTRMDRFANQYTSGELSQERFQHQFEKACMRMVTFCDRVLIPFAQKSRNGDIDMVDISKTKADFLRQLCCWCPDKDTRNKESGKDKNARDAYALALDFKATATSHWSHSVLSTYVNTAHFAAEVWRDRQEAIRICQNGRDFVNENSARKPNDRPSPASTMTWNLLESNLKAYKTWIQIFLIRFDESSLKQHAGAGSDEEATNTHPDTLGADQSVDRAMSICALESMERRMCASLDSIFHSSSNQSEKANVSNVAKKSEQDDRAARYHRAVDSWLKTRPLCSTFFKRIYDVRWVDQAEKYDSAGVRELVSKLEEKAKRKADNDSARTDKDKASISLSKEAGRAEKKSSIPTIADDCTFLCACLVTPRNLQWLPDEKSGKKNDGIADRATRLGLSDIGWGTATSQTPDLVDDLARELKAGPSGARDTREPIIKISNVTKKNDWDKLLSAMDDDGVIQPVEGADTRTCPHCDFDFLERMPLCMRCHAPRADFYIKVGGQPLYAGDRLMQPGSDRPDGVTVEDVKNKKARTMNFYTSLKVDSVFPLCRGAYVDNHEFFSGFGESHQNLTFLPSETYHSLHSMSLRIAKIHSELKEATVPARKIACMSARRDQIEAAGRGCK